MQNDKVDPELLAKLKKLEAKYEAMGQDLSSYLDGLLYSDYLTYWDYIHLDTLLSLQNPRTDFPDEKVFILYHQITELYFRLILNEQEMIIFQDPPEKDLFLKRINRLNRYFSHLVSSFDVMIDGMDSEQFLAFRMSLLPSSGFQSGQYRMIEINSTDFHLLTNYQKRQEMDTDTPIDDVYEQLYWRRGATELATGKKTLTLRQFEKKYANEFLSQAKKVQSGNLRRKLISYFQHDEDVKKVLKQYDRLANVEWPLCHLKSAARYLQRDPDVIKATGGTNWQKYLPPRHQMIVYFPELWSKEELQSWGTTFKTSKENI